LKIQEKTMKTRFLLIVVLAVVLTGAVAGDLAAQAKWNGGLRFGFNSSQFRGDNAARWVSTPNYSIDGTVHDALSGAVVGAFTRYRTDGWFGMQLEVNYSMQGGDGTVTGTAVKHFPSDVTYYGDLNGTLTVRMDYIEVPLLVMFALPSEDKVGFTPYLGPAFGYNTRTEAQIKGELRVPQPNNNDKVFQIDERISVGGGVNKWQVAGVVGAMLEFKMHSSIIQLDGRYTFGVTTVDKSNQKNIYNHTFSIVMAFMAPFQK
jgi:hypothetical protein